MKAAKEEERKDAGFALGSRMTGFQHLPPSAGPFSPRGFPGDTASAALCCPLADADCAILRGPLACPEEAMSSFRFQRPFATCDYLEPQYISANVLIPRSKPNFITRTPSVGTSWPFPRTCVLLSGPQSGVQTEEQQRPRLLGSQLCLGAH